MLNLLDIDDGLWINETTGNIDFNYCAEDERFNVEFARHVTKEGYKLFQKQKRYNYNANPSYYAFFLIKLHVVRFNCIAFYNHDDFKEKYGFVLGSSFSFMKDSDVYKLFIGCHDYVLYIETHDEFYNHMSMSYIEDNSPADFSEFRDQIIAKLNAASKVN